MSFKAEEKTISEILTTEGKFIIPRYQRKYVWEEKHWMELFEDLKFDFESKSNKTQWSHFLGSFVFEKDEKAKKEFAVIDGQQRITTIIIMLCTICTLFNEANRQDLFDGTKKYIESIDDNGEPYFKLHNESLENYGYILDYCLDFKSDLSSKRLFETVSFKKVPTDNKNVLNCFYFFHTSFKELMGEKGDSIERLIKIRDRVIDLVAIQIIAENQQESYNVFEILNARGVELKQYELLKNYIFKYVTPKRNIDMAKNKWAEIENLLYIKQYNYMEMFLKHYTIHKYCKPTGLNTEFKIIKGKNKKDKAIDLLNDIYNKVNIYTSLLSETFLTKESLLIGDDKQTQINDEIISKIKQNITFFNLRNHRQFRPLFLSIFSQYKLKTISLNDLVDFFDFIEKFYFAYGTICQLSSNQIESVIYRFAQEIENCDAKTKTAEFISVMKNNYYPDKDTFINGFIEMGYTNNSKNKKYSQKMNGINIRYILTKIENYYNTTNELTVNNFSVEHILSDNGLDANCKIGNLLPLAEPINHNAGNKPFTDKIKYYNRSNFESTKSFVKYHGAKQEWLVKDIDERGRKIDALAYDCIWKV